MRILPIVVVTMALTALALLLAVNFVGGESRIDKRVERLYGVDDPRFARELGILLGPPVLEGNRYQTLLNGDEIFPPMLAAIRSAQRTITFETYIYWSGEIGSAFADALADRARAGVKVHVLLDWIGSAKMDKAMIDEMKAAGVQVERFHPPHWTHLGRLNNRTHRKLLVVDGRIGFTGGVGIATEWTGHAQDAEHWRDTHFQVEGPVVAQMQAVFLDNWMKVSGQVPHGPGYFPALEPVADGRAQMFSSSPSGGSEGMQLLYLMAIASATHSIDLSAAYFVPDDLSSEALVAAMRRGVRLRIVVPGKHIDSAAARGASRSRWGPLLEHGALIAEYAPTMYHTKMMIVDGLLVSVGSTNFDNRSFRLNDEATLNILDARFAAEQTAVFERDLAKSRPIALAEWQARPWHEKNGRAAGLAAGFATLTAPGGSRRRAVSAARPSCPQRSRSGRHVRPHDRPRGIADDRRLRPWHVNRSARRRSPCRLGGTLQRLDVGAVAAAADACQPFAQAGTARRSLVEGGLRHSFEARLPRLGLDRRETLLGQIEPLAEPSAQFAGGFGVRTRGQQHGDALAGGAAIRIGQVAAPAIEVCGGDVAAVDRLFSGKGVHREEPDAQRLRRIGRCGVDQQRGKPAGSGVVVPGAGSLEHRLVSGRSIAIGLRHRCQGEPWRGIAGIETCPLPGVEQPARAFRLRLRGRGPATLPGPCVHRRVDRSDSEPGQRVARRRQAISGDVQGRGLHARVAAGAQGGQRRRLDSLDGLAFERGAGVGIDAALGIELHPGAAAHLQLARVRFVGGLGLDEIGGVGGGLEEAGLPLAFDPFRRTCRCGNGDRRLGRRIGVVGLRPGQRGPCRDQGQAGEREAGPPVHGAQRAAATSASRTAATWRLDTASHSPTGAMQTAHTSDASSSPSIVRTRRSSASVAVAVKTRCCPARRRVPVVGITARLAMVELSVIVRPGFTPALTVTGTAAVPVRPAPGPAACALPVPSGFGKAPTTAT